MRSRHAFTLIELLVVIAIIALLVSIILPALGETRRTAQNAVNQSNLRQLGIGIHGYATDMRDAFVNPFDTTAWPNIPVPRLQGFVWPFDDTSRATEMFAAHWASLLMNYINDNDLASKVQFAPADRAVKERFEQFLATGPDLASTIWDGSYFYPPTFWINPSRYTSASHVPLTNSSRQLWRRNRMDDVTSPQAKVLIFERFDFEQRRRLGPGAGGRVDGFPGFNNPEAKTDSVLVDGSVTRVIIAQNNALANSSDPETRDAFTPQGLWNPTGTLLNRYDMARDELETGFAGTIAYPAHLWATRKGLHGRDINK